METIVALATPMGTSGVAVVRISGEKSKEILQNLIHEKLDFEPRKMYLKKVYINNFVDTCLVVYFKAPFSFTGEDVVEIQSHGGYFLTQKIIEEVLKYDVRLADRGEFSKRAFVNGKMSLDQAEGIIDLINAESDMQTKTSSDLLNGKLKEDIKKYQSVLTDILAEVEAKLDYPEYEYTDAETSNILSKLENLKLKLKEKIDESRNGLLIKNGVKVAIVGAPNVGKSSLLNAMTKSEKAIVTDIAGTTRDVIEAEYTYNGIIFRLFDTAGIHESDNAVEKIGIDRAIKTIDDCDIVLKVSDKDNICNIKTTKPYVNVFNKCDLGTRNDKKYLYISAKNNENIDKLKKQIFDMLIQGDIRQNKVYLTNVRHIDCVKRALKHIENAIDLFDKTTMDIISHEIKSAWLILGEITGSTSDEKIIDKIFSKFCLGK